LLEIGSGTENDDTWVRGRRLTGRIVAISNKASFTEPVYNYSALFDFIWEELTVPVPHGSGWEQAERILSDEARRVSDSEGARRAIDDIARSYPVPRAEVEPRVFTRATDNYLELSARFVVPVRTSRSAKDDLTRRVVTTLREAGIEGGLDDPGRDDPRGNRRREPALIRAATYAAGARGGLSAEVQSALGRPDPRSRCCSRRTSGRPSLERSPRRTPRRQAWVRQLLLALATTPVLWPALNLGRNATFVGPCP
jgi:hypothetical protein